MEQLDQGIQKAVEIILGKAVRLDARLIEDQLEFILANLDNKDALERLFAVDKEDLKAALDGRRKPKNLTTKRYLVVQNALKGVIDAVYAGEVARVNAHLKAMKLTPKQQASLVRASMFMKPAIKAAFLTDTMKAKHQKVSLSERVWDFSAMGKDTLLGLIRSNVAEGKNPKVIKSIIRKQLLDQSDYNIKRVVITESRRLWQEVQKESYKEFKHIKYVKLKLSPKHKTKDICDEWVAKGLIPFEDAPSMPLHPNSRSILQAVATPREEWLKDMGIN